eukprot:9301462-Pyramimonas_sp.AAC.1
MRYRREAVSFIEAAKFVYLRYERDNEHEPHTYSTVWTRFADAVVEKILKAEPTFASAPMVQERPQRSNRREAGGSGASAAKIPTPPPPPSGSAGVASRPTPPPGPTRAERDDQLDAHQEQSSPTVIPSPT